MMQNIALIKQERDEDEAVQDILVQPDVEELRRSPRRAENVMVFVIVLGCAAGAMLLGRFAYNALHAGDRSILARVMEQQPIDSQSALL
jgi:hypothetical protein